MLREEVGSIRAQQSGRPLEKANKNTNHIAIGSRACAQGEQGAGRRGGGVCVRAPWQGEWLELIT